MLLAAGGATVWLAALAQTVVNGLATLYVPHRKGYRRKDHTG
jgi:hypothetical protein